MKPLFTLALASALLLLLAPLAVAAENADVSTVRPVESATCLAADGPAMPTFLAPVGWGFPSLPSCFNLEVASCTTPGTIVRCMWQPYEPGICACQPDNTYLCG